MLSFPFDVRIHVAKQHKRAWYLMYQYDIEFARWARTDAAVEIYAYLFAESWRGKDYTAFGFFGKMHSIYDNPAVIYDNGDKQWGYNDQLHRDGDRPAIVKKCGDEIWCQYGYNHRIGDKPAQITSTCKIWIINGKEHRDNDRPSTEWNSGSKEWYIHGERGRINDLPDVEKHDGTLIWHDNSGKVKRAVSIREINELVDANAKLLARVKKLQADADSDPDCVIQ